MCNMKFKFSFVFQTSLIDQYGKIMDTYTHKIGIRTVTWSNTTVYINDKPVYMRGFGMHEDSDVSLTKPLHKNPYDC